MEKSNSAYLNLYIGTQESGVGDILCLDMVIPDREVPVWCSATLDDASGQDFLVMLETVANESRLFTKYTGLPLRVDFEGILEYLEDIDESMAKLAKTLLKELKETK